MRVFWGKLEIVGILGGWMAQGVQEVANETTTSPWPFPGRFAMYTQVDIISPIVKEGEGCLISNS